MLFFAPKQFTWEVLNYMALSLDTSKATLGSDGGVHGRRQECISCLPPAGSASEEGAATTQFCYHPEYTNLLEDVIKRGTNHQTDNKVPPYMIRHSTKGEMMLL